MQVHTKPNVVAETVPYPWPYDGALDPARTALVICGVQRGLAAVSSDATDVIARLAELAAVVRARGGTVMWVRHGTRPAPSAGPSTLLAVRGTSAWELAAPPDAADVIVDASGWDGSFGSDLDPTLRAFDTRTIVLGGLASEITVDSTVRTLNDRGHECLVLTDGCAPADAVLGARAHHSLTMSGGIFGALGTTTHLIDALTAVSGSGPAYVFHLVEALADAGTAAGLPPDMAARLARATVAGAGALLDGDPRDAGRLRQDVTSPGGTTAEALAVLMRADGLSSLMREAVAAAKRRAGELSG